MAGGKETPRQKLIGLMYLVLLAMLALNISAAILEKFQFLDESMMVANEQTHTNNGIIERKIAKAVEDNGNRAGDKAVLAKADEIAKEADEIITYISELRKFLVEETGGMTEEGGYKGASDEGKVTEVMLGPEGSKKGKGYEFKKKLDDFTADVKSIMKGENIKIESLALDGKEDPMFKDNPEQRKKDFAELSFGHTPLVAALAVLSTKEAQVLKQETVALNALAQKVGASDLAFDKIEGAYTADAKVVAAGTKYRAELFLLASSSSIKPNVKVNGKDLKVEGGRGIYEITASGGGYDKEGLAKRTYKGEITINNKGVDTTFQVTGEYYVAKPVIQIQSASVSALYRNCGNQLNVQVPALGSAYQPKFTASGAQVINGKKKGEVVLIPTAPKVKLNVASSGTAIGSETFNVRLVPKPTIEIRAKGKPIPEKTGMNAPGPSSLKAVAVPDEHFKSFLPKDARFGVTKWEVILVRGRRPVKQTVCKSSSCSISSLKKVAREGDRIVIDIKEVQRKNFKDKMEKVPMPTIIKNLPLH